MDGSIGSHFKAAAKAIETHVDVKQAVVGTQQRMKLAVAETMGLDPTAEGNQLYLTLASLLPLVPIVFLIACVVRVIKETITMYRAVQIANVYCASFCGMLVVSGLFTHSEPLASYQFLSGNSKYVQYQLVVLFVFALYLILGGVLSSTPSIFVLTYSSARRKRPRLYEGVPVHACWSCGGVLVRAGVDLHVSDVYSGWW